MAFVGVSDDFDLDDDGILRDSMSGAGLLIDDEGILRDDSLDMYKHVVRGHWTDSGFSGDKQSSTSTLQHLQNSFEEDLAPIGDESINISEFEASKDDLSFERQDETYVGNERKRVKSLLSLGLMDTMESTLDKPQDFEDEPPSKQNRMVSGSMNQNSVDFNNTTADFDNQRFPPEYYKELRELGVLVDGADLTRDSLDDFDGTESKLEDEQNRENEDLIAEYLESEYRREIEEEEEGKREEGIKTRRENAFRRSHESGVMADAFSRPSSAQTISSRSFPDDVDDDGNEIMSQNLGSQSQKTTGEDEEIFNITSRILPTSPADVLRGKSDQLRRSSYTSKSGKDSNTVLNKNASYQGAVSHSRGSTPGLSADNHHPYDEDARSVYSEAAPLRSRPSSTTSHFSTASEIVSARQKKAEEAAVQRMSKARSQESFFEGEQTPTNSGEKTQHKRLLPTMSNSEPTHSFKLKSKSVSNIASKAGPVKPTHMTVMEISRLTNMENPAPLPWEDNHTSKLEQDDELPGELSTRLTQEAQKRKQATELVQQLQKDYDNLLTKYALAELTIDQMRLGAKITLHTDSPTPGQAQSRIMSPIPPGQSAQVVSVRQSPSQAVKLPGHGVLGQVSPLADVADHVDGRHPLMSDQRSRSRPDLLKSSLSSLRQSIAENEDGLQEVPELVTETVKTDMLMQAKDMDDRLESFYTLLEQRQLTFEEQEQVFEKIKTDHDVLRRAYLQAKDDYNVLRRSGAITTDVQNFDQNKELEGQLFRLGMRFDEVQERVEKNLKERPVQRQPFSSDNSNRLEDEKKKGKDHKTDPKDDNDGKGGGKVASGLIKSLNTSRTTSVESTDDHTFERRAQELREEYNSNMDAYRKLKFLASTPQGEKQMESVVRRLNEICTEMPEMFRLSPEIQDRYNLMHRENRLQLNDRKNSVWEKLNRREQEVKSQRSPVPQLSRDGRSTVSSGRSTVSSGRGSDMADSESLRAPLDVSGRSSLGSILPDRYEHPSPRGRHGPSSNGIYSTERPSSRGSNPGYEPGRTPSRPRSTAGDDNSFADSSYYGQDSSNPNLPRPRRHAHELRDPKLSKMPDMGSSHHLPDSMAPGQSNLSSSFNARGQDTGPRGSESGGAVGGMGGGGGGATSRGTGDDAEGALAALPGPGKFKQMTKQRAADDADSGFIGSMVGSGVGEPPALIQQQEEQQQLALRLRQQADDSSTITDQSFSTSTQGSERSSDKHHKAAREGSRPQRKSRGSGGSRGDASYDGEGDTLESLDSGTSSKKERGTKPAKPRDQRKVEKSNVSSSATFEEGSTAESDASTPRAASNQSSGKVNEKQTTGQQAPTSISKPASRTQTVTETRAGAQAETTDSKPKTKPGVTEGQQTSEKESSAHQTQVKSAAPPPPAPHSRPSSRGSPTTDLYQTRSRRTSVESGRGGRAGAELSRHERELRQERAELRNTRLSLHAQGRLTDSPSAPPPLVLPPDPRNSEIARRVKEYEERSVGSDVEVGSSITTRASSVNSSIRLKALQEEVEKLKAGFAKANERASQPPPPPQIVHVPGPPLPSAERKQEPEYYDPFDDPYGFMRMPRRRANSFSGGRERDWDEWYWTLPQNRQYDGGDIPLGYAAADAYAEHPRVPIVAGRERNTKENVKNRMRQKRLERKHRGDIPPTDLDAGGAGAETVQQPSPGAAGLVEEQPAALYDYYLPSRYSAQAMRQQMASRGYFTTPSGGKIYSSTGEEADNEEERGVLSDTAYLAGSASPAQSRPWYQIRRAARPFASAYVGQGEPRAQSHDDLRYEPGNPTNPYINQQARATAHAANNTTTASQACPMCGVSSYHAHANFVHTGFPAPTTSPPKYSSHTFDRDRTPTRHSRPRSRSASRTRSYTPGSRSRYSVREYSPLSDSDGEEQTSRRSRSLSRGRTRDRSRPRREAHRHKRRSESASDLSDEEVALDRSLSLSMDISRLTHKMLGTLRVELKRSSEKRDYGSSYW
ncbi:unnamed protein product [Lymnaea stagnalis]|uniref:Uncharacterized protein n=1 Tax=Lymnaea stagnalis TaxID=6523 RepID=A0AAV2IMS1_LYMST